MIFDQKMQRQFSNKRTVLPTNIKTVTQTHMHTHINTHNYGLYFVPHTKINIKLNTELIEENFGKSCDTGLH